MHRSETSTTTKERESMRKEFYTVQEVAAKTGVSIATVRRWIKSGKLDSTQAGHIFRVSPEQLAAFMNGNKGSRSISAGPQPLYNADGSPQYMGGTVPQPKICPHCGEQLETVRGLVYTDQSGVYAIFEDGQPTGQFMRTIGV